MVLLTVVESSLVEEFGAGGEEGGERGQALLGVQAHDVAPLAQLVVLPVGAPRLQRVVVEPHEVGAYLQRQPRMKLLNKTSQRIS